MKINTIISLYFLIFYLTIPIKHNIVKNLNNTKNTEFTKIDLEYIMFGKSVKEISHLELVFGFIDNKL